MIETGTKIAIALVVAAAASAGIAVGLSSSASGSNNPIPAPRPQPSPGPAPSPSPPTGIIWTPAPSQIVSGTRVRVSVSQADLAVLAQSIGTSADYNGWINLLSNPVVQSALQSSTLSAWGPNPSGDGTMYPAPLPGDWPADDVNASSEYHAEFVYGGTQPLLLSAFPVPIRAWIATAH